MAPAALRLPRHASEAGQRMSWDSLLVACALVLVLEGLMPFLSPARWRQVFEQVVKLSDGQLRFIGLLSMLTGLLLLVFLGD
jgi:uncharacterized protein YjeT (DUF2065 family)